MDADLQHDPIYIPSLIKPIIEKRAEFVVGSRFVSKGAIVDWPLQRKIISKVATLLAAPLVSISDPMSGYFCLTRDLYKLTSSSLNPVGYKICLEILVRSQCRAVVEVGYLFFSFLLFFSLYLHILV